MNKTGYPFIKKACPDSELFLSMANDRSIGNKDIAKCFGVSLQVVIRWCKEHSIDRSNLRNNEGKKPTKDVIELLYNSGLSMVEISKKLGVSNVTIKNWLIDYNIQTRQLSETSRLAYKKATETVQKRYGKEHIFQSTHFSKKSRETFLERYGVDHPSKSKIIQDKNIKKFGHKFGMHKSESPSAPEKDLINKLNELGLSLAPTRNFFDDKRQLDGYDAERKIAIEYNGLYWHCELNIPDKMYHYKKWKDCRDNGVRLYTVFADEWLLNQDKVMNYLSANIGLFSNKLSARQTKFVGIPKNVGKNFISRFHLQGHNQSSNMYFGLCINEELLSVMSFGPHHRSSNKLVMNRFCSKPGTLIVGGASKLIQNSWISLGKPEITTWSDNRWSNGNVYEKMGCIKISDIKPDHYYTNGVKRTHKQNRKKSVIGCPKEILEAEFNASLGWYRIWDCGKVLWKYNGQ